MDPFNGLTMERGLNASIQQWIRNEQLDGRSPKSLLVICYTQLVVGCCSVDRLKTTLGSACDKYHEPKGLCCEILETMFPAPTEVQQFDFESCEELQLALEHMSLIERDDAIDLLEETFKMFSVLHCAMPPRGADTFYVCNALLVPGEEEKAKSSTPNIGPLLFSGPEILQEWVLSSITVMTTGRGGVALGDMGMLVPFPSENEICGALYQRFRIVQALAMDSEDTRSHENEQPEADSRWCWCWPRETLLPFVLPDDVSLKTGVLRSLFIPQFAPHTSKPPFLISWLKAPEACSSPLKGEGEQPQEEVSANWSPPRNSFGERLGPKEEIFRRKFWREWAMSCCRAPTPNVELSVHLRKDSGSTRTKREGVEVEEEEQQDECMKPQTVFDGSWQPMEPLVVRTPIEYHHYRIDGFDDRGWGCAYRSLQTVLSWFRFKGASIEKIPTLREIQHILTQVDPMRKGKTDSIKSKEWIGSFEVMLVLQHYLPALECRIHHVDSGVDLIKPEVLRELVAHFRRGGAPVMIGGAKYAHTIVGVDVNMKTLDAQFLIYDPHYPGEGKEGGTDVAAAQRKGFIGWKLPPKFFDLSEYYNMCIPLYYV